MAIEQVLDVLFPNWRLVALTLTILGCAVIGYGVLDFISILIVRVFAATAVFGVIPIVGYERWFSRRADRRANAREKKSLILAGATLVALGFVIAINSISFIR
jgi:hypothetical protein